MLVLRFPMYDFHSPEHATSYLSNSVIRYANEPIMVETVDDENYILFHTIMELAQSKGRLKMRMAELDSEHINMKPVPLGMFNFCDEAGNNIDSAYLSRIPNRGWKVGLTSNNTNIYIIRPEYDNVFQSSIIRNLNILKSISFYNTVMNIYPSYQYIMEEFELAKSRRRSVAFSRNFAIIAEDRKLMYRYFKNPVGVALDNGPRLEARYDLLNEILNEDINHG